MQQDDKKQIYIGPTIQHIQPSEFLIKHQNNLLLLHKRQLLLLNLETQSITTSKIDSDKITSSSVHDILNIYLVKTPTHIHVVNEAGEALAKILLKEEIALMASKFIFIVPMQDGQCQDPHERIDKLIYITEENMHISNIKITFERAILKNKRITTFDFHLVKPEKYNQIDPTIVFDAPQWIEKCKIFKDLGYFVCYNSNELMVFKLPSVLQQTLQLYLTYKKTSKSQNLITDVAISTRQKQIIFSHQSGVIKVYRFNETKKYLQQLRGHQKQCHSLFISSKNNKDILYSSGYDNTIRIWNLYQFEEIYALRIDLIVDDIVLLSDELAFVEWSGRRKSCLCKINAYKMEPIMTENKGGKIVNLKCDGEWGIVLYSNNYAEMFLTDQQGQKQQVDPMEEINGKKLKNYIQKIQFPLKYGNVVSAKKVRKNQYAIILEKGFSMITLNKDEIISENFELKKLVYNEQIAHIYSDSDASEDEIDQIYNVHEQKHQKQKQIQNQKPTQQIHHEAKNDNRLVELIHEKLLGTYLFGILEDWKGIPTAINVTFVTFVTGKALPMWDMEQKKKVPPKNSKDQQAKQRKRKKSLIPVEQNDVKVEDMVHVVLGTDRGVIFIVDIQNRVQFESRVVMHTGAIEYIKQFTPKSLTTSFSSSHTSDETYFMSLDQSRQICFWSLSEEHPPNIYCRVTNQRDITHLSLHDEYLLVGEKEGKVSVLEIIWEELKEENSASKSPALLSPTLRKKDSRATSRDSIRHRASKIYFKTSKNDSLYGHMKKVTTGDHIYFKQKHLFVTGSQDCTIKLWLGLQKILLFQLKIFDTIEHIRFVHRGIDFLMAHHDQVSVIKAQNIEEIQHIQNGLDSKYLKLPYFGVEMMAVKTFFNKENEYVQLSKPSNFRLKMKHSLKQQPISKLTDDLINKTSNGFALQLNDIRQQPQKNQNQVNEVNFLTKLQEKQLEVPKYFSPEKKLPTEEQRQKRLKVYAKSEEKIKARKSFHVANTAESKEYNETYFMLPKIMSKNAGGSNKKKASTSFESSSFLQGLKSQRQKAYSYFARYSQK